MGPVPKSAFINNKKLMPTTNFLVFFLRLESYFPVNSDLFFEKDSHLT